MGRTTGVAEPTGVHITVGTGTAFAFWYSRRGTDRLDIIN